MRLKILLTLVLSPALSFAYSQPAKNVDCEETIKQNIRLANEKLELGNKLDSITLVNEKRGNYSSRYSSRNREHDYYKNLYNKERTSRDSVEVMKKLCAEKITIITKERDEFKGQLDSLKNICYTSAEDHKPVLVKSTLNSSVLAMLGKLKALEDESNDYISVQGKQVKFRGKPINYGNEVLFIPYKGDNQTDCMVLNDSLTYSINRLIKLVSKYDHGVKLKLVGECSNKNDKKKTKQNCIDRAENLKTHLKCTPYNLSESFFANNPQDEEKDERTGVSIRIVNK
jgi:hypothetical protein